MSHDARRGRRTARTLAAALAVLLVASGLVLIAIALQAQKRAPQPPAPPRAESPSVPSTSASASASTSAPTGPALPAAAPTHLDIPAIGVASDLLQLGLNPDDTVQVPPLDRDSQAGWFDESPSPGQIGPSVILGHVDSAEYGPAVFFRLGALRPGDQVSVTRADNQVAVFRVDDVASYPKDRFPTLAVYGNTDHAALRLITCGGPFDAATRNYENNIVAYASLVSSHPA